MSREIERKFLLPSVPEWLGDHPSHRIDQGYLAVTADTEVRVRRQDDDCTLAVKQGAGESREEVELPVAPDTFEDLWALTEGRRVGKHRHVVPITGDLRAEVDVYHGPLEGLVTAEVEFDSDDAARDFQAPAWLGDEVTGDPGYANQQLALGRPPV